MYKKDKSAKFDKGDAVFEELLRLTLNRLPGENLLHLIQIKSLITTSDIEDMQQAQTTIKFIYDEPILIEYPLVDIIDGKRGIRGYLKREVSSILYPITYMNFTDAMVMLPYGDAFGPLSPSDELLNYINDEL